MAMTSLQHDTFVQRTRAFDQIRREIPALARLDQPSVDQLLEWTKVRLYTRNSVLAVPGTSARYVHAVLHGTLVERSHAGGMAREIARRGPGSFAGLPALLDQEPTLLEVIAVDHTQVLEFDAFALAQSRAAFHPVALQFSQVMLPLMVSELHAMIHRSVVVAGHKQMNVRGSPV
jgi:CRP-like cAMP-binding protein